jgi:His-Xaa-Ser system radical SAM maturase HxsB
MAVKAAKRTERVPQVYWRDIGGRMLLTNDFGSYAVMTEAEFRRYMKTGAPPSPAFRDKLGASGFLRERLDMEALAAGWRRRNAFLFAGPGLHILVMTLRCNQGCLYCQSGAVRSPGPGTDMSWETARRCVDLAFASPAPAITIEFQGGEPLLNWGVLKKTVDYARSLEKKKGKPLSLALISNFTLMDEKKAEFLLSRECSICTSLDGPADLHDRNRPFSGASSHAAVVRWLKYFKRRSDRQGPGYRIFKPGALLTVSRDSLGRGREIVDEYAGLGLEDIFLRPLAPIGYAKRAWPKIGYSAEEFSRFYAGTLDHIIALNARGTRIKEKTASMFLEKILAGRDPGFMDARCPCGAGVGQLAYDPRGQVYTCDEGRMMGWEGDDMFRIGDVRGLDYGKIASAPASRACCASSNLEQQPMCSRCAYRPYCGVCPVYNFEAQRSLWGHMPSNGRCAVFMGIFDAIFRALASPKKAKILAGWTAE